MHEMSTVLRFCNLAIETATEQKARGVEEIVVEVGEMTDILPAYLYKYYPAATKGTILEGSTLTVEKVPVKAECADCGTVFHPDREHDYKCPACGGVRAHVLAGRSVNLREVRVIKS
ncbi:MAG: hydrogenase maturation nickel metallochaperone HypA [Lachnospiraceae bacterium]|nr:hydrogenase maturation nickel metallochaperone HypA [Lachnospiraceae bacterium]